MQSLKIHYRNCLTLVPSNIRPWYLTQSVIIDIANRAYLLQFYSNFNDLRPQVAFLPLNVTMTEMIGRVLHNRAVYYIILDQQQLWIVRDITEPKPSSLNRIIYDKVKRGAFSEEPFRTAIVVIADMNDQVYYCRNPTKDLCEWIPIAKIWSGAVTCLTVLVKQNRIIIRLITDRLEHYIIFVFSRDDVRYHLCSSENTGTKWCLLSLNNRLEIKDEGIKVIPATINGKKTPINADFFSVNNTIQFRLRNGLVTDGYNILAGVDGNAMFLLAQYGQGKKGK